MRAPFWAKSEGRASKSASNIGSITSFAAVCTTRSRILGIPNGRSLPFDFGMYTTHRAGLVLFRLQLLVQLREKLRPSASFDLFKGFPVRPRSSAVSLRQQVSVLKYVLPVHLVVERIETKLRLLFCPLIERPLQFLEFLRSC